MNKTMESEKKGNTSQLEKDFVEVIEEIGEISNLDSLSSKILGYIIISQKPISMDEISQKTGYSIASIFNKANIMERFGVIKRMKKPGSKKIYFFTEVLDGELLKEQIQLMDKKITLGKEGMERIKEKYKNKKLSKEDLKRMEKVKSFLDYSNKAEKVIKKARKIIENEFS